MHELFGSKVQTDVINDANAEVLALAFDHARAQPCSLQRGRPSPPSTVLMTLHVGAGVGAGIITLGHCDDKEFSFCRSRLFVGAHGFSGEIGHLQISEHDIASLPKHPGLGLSPLVYGGCSCGEDSHLEGYVGTRSLAKRLLASDHPALIGDRPFEAQWADLYQEDDVVECLKDIGRLLGRAFAGAIRVIDPEELQLTGPLGVTAVKDGMDKQSDLWSQGGAPHNVTITTGASPLEEGHGQEAVRGAGLAILRRHLYRPLDETVKSIPRGSQQRPWG